MALDIHIEQFVDAASRGDVPTMEKMAAEAFDPKKQPIMTAEQRYI